MRRLLLLGLLALFPAVLIAGSRGKGISPGQDGYVRIVQFTDTHIDFGTDYRRLQGEKTFARISRVVRSESPDLIVFTGDVVTGKPAVEAWRRLVDSLNVFKIPFVVALGNHDAEQDLSRSGIASIVTSSPYSLNILDMRGELADVEIPLLKGGKPASAVYCLDSHDYSTIENIEGYGWFDHSQVDWLRDRTAALTKANGGKPLPSLAFFHIVLKEYVEAWKNPENTHIGRAAEDECPGAINTGMLAAMLESGSVMGTFVGHDHDIDYIVAENGLAMGYGRFSGDDTTYNNLRPGARVICLRPGERSFETWIVEDDGRVVDRVIFKDSIITKRRNDNSD